MQKKSTDFLYFVHPVGRVSFTQLAMMLLLKSTTLLSNQNWLRVSHQRQPFDCLCHH